MIIFRWLPRRVCVWGGVFSRIANHLHNTRRWFMKAAMPLGYVLATPAVEMLCIIRKYTTRR